MSYPQTADHLNPTSSFNCVLSYRFGILCCITVALAGNVICIKHQKSGKPSLKSVFPFYGRLITYSNLYSKCKYLNCYDA